MQTNLRRIMPISTCSLRSLVVFTLLLVAFSAPAPAQPSAEPDSAGFVTLLGRDTLAVEYWVRTPERLEAMAAVRSPRTQLRRFALDLTADGMMRRYEAHLLNPDDPSGAPLQTEVVASMGDHWMRTVTEGGAPKTEHLEAEATLLPFIELVSWPYELVFRRHVGAASATQPLLAGGRTLAFTVGRTAPDSLVLIHPFRGSSVARVDAAGRLLSLDATATTRKVTVTRVPRVDVAAHAQRWAAADRAGRGFGELSGRAQVEATVGAAHIALDYGTPSKRGRDIFGNVVPWNTLWRTGANRATHFSTDRPLVLGDPAAGTLEVPAGEYTLFTIPAPEGGVLIVNRQTNQNGNAYDASQDLGRVPMQRRETAEVTERFTIEVEPLDGRRGMLRIAWDRSAFEVPFEVQ